MAPFFEAPDGSKPDEVMVELDEVFYVKWCEILNYIRKDIRKIDN